MAKRNQVTSGRFVVGSAGLEAPARVDVKVGHGYWLGASGSPEYVIVVSITDDVIVYVNTASLARSTVARWIGEDLIVRGGTTIDRRAADDQNNGSPCASFSMDRAAQHGAIVTAADYDRCEVTLRGVGSADHYGIAKRKGLLTGWDGERTYTVECSGAAARNFENSVNFELTGTRLIQACQVS